jgi:hypothetical protein
LDDKLYTPAELLEYLRSRPSGVPWTYEMAQAMLGSYQERDYISTTSLTAKCLRQAALQRREPYDTELESMWAAFRGTCFHGRLESAADLDVTKEEARFHVDLRKVLGRKKAAPFSGSPDLVDVKHGLLWDWKFVKDGKAPRYGSPWTDHIEQAQINRWLVDHFDFVEYRGEKLPADEVAADFRPMDWQGLMVSYCDDRGVTTVTITRGEKVPTQTGGTKTVRVPDVWPDERVEDLIRERYPDAESAFGTGPVPTPPPGWELTSHVLCGYCPVRKQCLELQLGERNVRGSKRPKAAQA